LIEMEDLDLLQKRFQEAQAKLDKFYEFFKEHRDLAKPVRLGGNPREYNEKLSELGLIEKHKSPRSPLEYAFYLILEILNVEFQTQFFVSIGQYDFYIPQFKLLVELDGERYHKDPATDNERTKEAQKNGYLIFRYTSKEIYKHEKDKIPILKRAGLLTVATDLQDLSGYKQNLDTFKFVVSNATGIKHAK